MFCINYFGAVMKRRTILKNAASAGLLTFGATGIAAATAEEDPKVSVLDEETGEHVTKRLSETDVEAEDCCFEPDGCSACTCVCCYC